MNPGTVPAPAMRHGMPVVAALTQLVGRQDETSPQALRAALQRGLPGFAEGVLRIEGLHLLKLRRSSSHHRHPHPLTLLLALEVRDSARAQRGMQHLYLKSYRGGASAAAFAAASRTGLACPAFGAALAHLPELDMLCWAWPNDPGLPQLPSLLDPPTLLAHLPASLRASLQAQGDVRVRHVQALRHEPERRATLRCELDTAQGPRTIYGKTFSDERGAVILACFERAWHLAGTDPLAALVAQPLGYDAPSRTLWQATAPGVPLLSVPPAQTSAAMQSLGLALGRLHQMPLASAAQRPVAHWLLEAQRRANKLARVSPPLAERAGALLTTLRERTAELPELPLSLIHGDFHPEQVWLHEGRPVLFDFDEFACGHPMEDLAAFIIKWDAARPHADRAAVTALLQGYRQAAPHLWQPLWLQWHFTVQALLQASRAFVFQVPGWPQEVARRLALAEGHAVALSRSPA